MKRFRNPIIYGKQELGGILVRPDSRQVMKMAAAGHPVDVSSGNDYINLYHVFERLMESNPKQYAGLRLVRTQLGRSRWRLYVLRDGECAPEVELDDGYDPKRGRYKGYAEQLAAGEEVVLDSREEAIKARRAWQLYVPSEKRKHLRSSVKRVGKSARFTVIVSERNP